MESRDPDDRRPQLTWKASMSPTVERERAPIAAAVVVANGEVLLVRRWIEEGELSWQFPAGKVEPGESGDDAAVRETREETGLTVRAASQLGSRVHPSTGRTMWYVACEVVDGTAHVAAEDEIAEVAWCDRTTLAAKVPYPFHGPVQEHLDANLR
jgi:8-oxo-dGTP diphosphatase